MTNPGWEYYQPVEEGNPLAGLHAGLWALGSWVALMVVVLPREDAHTDAVMSGQLLAPASIVWVVTWLVAHLTKARWGWWVYALVVPGATLGVALFGNAEELVDYAERRSAAGGSRSDGSPATAGEAAQPAVRLEAFASTPAWTKVDTKEARAVATLANDQLVEQSDGLLNADDVVAGLYVQSAQTGTPVFFLGINANPEHDEAETLVEDMLTGGSVEKITYSPAGEPGEILGCGNAEKEGQKLVSCAWSNGTVSGYLIWTLPSVGVERASRLTMDFRDLATRPLTGR
jgi:hypothetical protein